MDHKRRELLKITALGLGAWATGLPLARAATATPRIRAIFETPMEEPFVTQLHLAMTRIAKEDGLDYKYSESVKAADFPRVLRQWCEEGIELIVGDAYGTEQMCRRVAGDYAETAFTLGSAMGPTGPNVSTFYGQNYEAAYLAGMLAAKMSKSGVFGSVGGYPIPEVNLLINAFRLGVKEVKPDAKFLNGFIGTWFDPPKAKEAALAQIDAGADVLFGERIGTADAAKERGVLAIGSLIDYTPRYPGAVFANAIWNFRPTVDAIVADVLAGKPVGRDYTEYSFMKYGGNELIYVKEQVPADALPAMEAKEAAIKSGAFEVPIDAAEPA